MNQIKLIATGLNLLAMFIFSTANAQVFTTPAWTTDSIAEGDAAWGDYDGDGDLDLLVTGHSASNFNERTIVYENTGSGFTPLSGSFDNDGGSYSGAATWADLNNDNLLDFILAGTTFTSNDTIAAYIGDGSGSFTRNNLPFNLISTAADWGDYDNDGDNDLLCVGYEDFQTTGFVKIARNNGNGTFTEVTTTATGVWTGDGEWADYDFDGDLDFAYLGSDPNSSGAPFCKLYRNEGNDVFTEVANTPFMGLDFATLTWGDVDGNAYPDLFISGYDANFAATTVLYMNTNGTFTASAHNFGAVQGEAVIGDVNNDAFPDIIVSGFDDNSNSSTRLWTNDGALGGWTDAGIIDSTGGRVVLGDYNDDGKLDLVVTGQNFASPVGQRTSVYMNMTPSANQAPDVPQMLTATQTNDSIWIGWQGTFDPEGTISLNPNPCTYALWISSSLNGVDVLSPQADTATGLRNIAATSRTYITAWSLKNASTSSNHYIRVQSVDPGYKGSGWSSVYSIITTGTADPMGSLMLTAFPNPTSDLLKVSLDGNTRLETIQLYTPQGQLVREIDARGSMNAELHLAGLTSGIYMMNATTIDGRKMTVKVFKD